MFSIFILLVCINLSSILVVQVLMLDTYNIADFKKINNKKTSEESYDGVFFYILSLPSFTHPFIIIRIVLK